MFHHYMNILQKMMITLLSSILVLGIIGNGLVIWISGFRMKNTISAVWFLHLAIADFLCCASLPLRIVQWTELSSFYVYISFCFCNIFLFYLNMTSSVLLLTAMSIDRWVSVMWPFWAKVHRTPKLVRITAAIIWGLSLIVTGLVFFLYAFYLDDRSEWCLEITYTHPEFREMKETIQLIRLVIMCVIPFFIIFTSYVTIFYKLRKNKRSQRSQRSSRIITAVILCFFICWFPYYIWPITAIYVKDIIPFVIVNNIITSLACLNSCINPIIYVFMGPDFQQCFFRSIPSRLEKVLSDHPNDLSREQEDLGNALQKFNK
ncbi:N-formyl peptide receptor 2-like isoform X2 [Phyllobates terribilis]